MEVLMDDHGDDDDQGDDNDHDGHGGHDDQGDYDRNEYGYDLVSDPVPSFPSVLKVNDKWMGWN